MITDDDIGTVRGRKDLRILQATAAGGVAFYFDANGSGVDFLVDGGIPCLVTGPMRFFEKRGLVHLRRRQPGTARRQMWELTDKGRAVLDHWTS